MTDPTDLLPFYRDDDRTRVRFVGGPCHGRTILWGTGTPPDGIVLPVDPGPTVADVLDPYRPLEKAFYIPRLDAAGHPSRDDDGTLVYEHSG
ncbi:hypothetical protein DV517_62110 [Streptomyces sp. S816]|uniref:hypothetical protein n=1 Tax=Streptomyces sp. S816 TaxID=2283197 RepID=UPI00109CCB3C|nr:hypothetical protein [Streptomyces sp. S816]TGZ14728.1 hypothetical protein DV517_62110 [Streptomyces sp. S816]